LQNGQGQHPYHPTPQLAGNPGGASARLYTPPQAQAGPPPHNNSQTAPVLETKPTIRATAPHMGFTSPPGVNSATDDFVSRLSARLGGRAVFKRLLLATLLFFSLFIIIAGAKFLHDVNAYKNDQISRFQASLTADVNSVARALDSEIEWMDTALALPGNPQQIVNFAARARNVVGASILNGNGKILAETPGAGAQLAALDRRNFPKNGVTIDSLINDKGTATPIITRKTGDNYLVVALAPGTLIGQRGATRALIRDTGRVIDGPSTVASQGPQTFYRISANRLSEAVRGTESSTISAHSRDDQKMWFGAVRIPNSYLSVMDIKPRTTNPTTN